MPRKSNEELYEEAERAAVLDAIGETEQEIFDDALNRDPDDNDGDTSLEEIDGEDVLDGDDTEGEEGDGDEAGEGEGEGGEGDEQPPETRHDQAADRRDARVPPSRLREEAESRRVAEAEREQARAEARELRARLDALERGQQRPPQGQTQQNEPPDIFADPEGRLAWERNQVAQQFEERRINASFEDARESHGDKFLTAFQDLQKTGDGNLVREIVNSNNPGRALMNWHQRQALMSEIGTDPAAYRQRVRDELLADPETRRAVITGARNDAMRGDGGQPRTQTRLPPSLNGATGGTSHRGGTGRGRDTAATTRSTEQEIFDSVWDD